MDLQGSVKICDTLSTFSFPLSLSGCDVVLPITALIPCLADHFQDGNGPSADIRIVIERRDGSKEWSVTSNSPLAGLSRDCSKKQPSPKLSMPVLPPDNGHFWLRLKNGKLRNLLMCGPTIEERIFSEVVNL